MKFANLAVAVASLVAPATLVAGAPRVVQAQPADLKPRKIGGSTFRLSQVHNDMFRQHGKGPRALAKAYEKYEIELPPTLLGVLRKIFKELGIDIPSRPHRVSAFGAQSIGAPYTNETDDKGGWMDRWMDGWMDRHGGRR